MDNVSEAPRKHEKDRKYQTIPSSKACSKMSRLLSTLPIFGEDLISGGAGIWTILRVTTARFRVDWTSVSGPEEISP